MSISPTTKASDAARALTPMLEKKFGTSKREELSPAQIEWAQTMYRRLLLLVPQNNGGYAGRSERWLLNHLFSKADISAVLWGGPFNSIEQAAERLASDAPDARRAA